MQKQTIGSEQTLQSPFVTQFRFNRKKLFKYVRQQFWFHSYCTYTAPLFNLIFRYFICSNLSFRRSVLLNMFLFLFLRPLVPSTFVNVFLCFSCVLVSSFCRSSILSCSFFLFPRTFVSSLANLRADIDLLVTLELKASAENPISRTSLVLYICFCGNSHRRHIFENDIQCSALSASNFGKN